MLGYIVFHVVHEHLPQSSACECNSVTCADSPSVRNRRMLSCSRAVLSHPWTNDRRDTAPRIPFHFTPPSFLGHPPASPHSREGHGVTGCVTHPRCLQYHGLGKVQTGSRNGGAMRSSGARFENLWLGSWSRVGRRCASRSDVVARKNDGGLHCSIRLTAGLTSVARI
jgi:hypothetical protein